MALFVRSASYDFIPFDILFVYFIYEMFPLKMIGVCSCPFNTSDHFLKYADDKQLFFLIFQEKKCFAFHAKSLFRRQYV